MPEVLKLAPGIARKRQQGVLLLLSGNGAA